MEKDEVSHHYFYSTLLQLNDTGTAKCKEEVLTPLRQISAMLA